MVAITVDVNTEAITRALAHNARQAKFAVAVALTRTAKNVKDAEYEQMRKSFDRPTTYTLRSLYMKPATRAKLEARVWLKDESAGSGTPASKYLLPQIEGGPRNVKRFEKALQAAGHMPHGYKAVPGRFAKLDRFGNVSFGQIIQILSQLNITLTAGHARNISTDPKKAARARRRAGGQFFAVPTARGRLRPGIYQRRDFAFGSAAPRPVFIFVPRVTYRRRFPFAEVAQRVIAAEFPAHFARAWDDAIRTARP